MAKSLRSKWKRKCRAVKRVRYAQKELERLKKTLGIDDSQVKDINMTEINDIVNVTNASDLKAKASSNEDNVVMDMDDDGLKFNPKTLRNQHGAYPVWLHPRKLAKKKKSKNKKSKSNKKK